MDRLHRLMWGWIAVLIATCLFASPVIAQSQKKYASKHYTIYSDLTTQETRHLGLHMDAVYEQYVKRFRSFGKSSNKQASIYLFRHKSDYLQFLNQYDFDANNSSAIFFVRPGIEALAAYLNEYSIAQTLASLQHEGFHQFAYQHIGPNLPVWINEGLAQYFEDGLLVKDTLKLGHFDTFRSEYIKQKLTSGKIMDITYLVNLTARQWHDQVVADAHKSQTLYAQSWSIVYFLANNNQYSRKALEDYLHDVSNGQVADDAFFKAFGTTPDEFTRHWGNYAVKLQPDPLTAASARMQFLGESMRWLDQKGQPFPDSLEQLRKILQAVKFKSVWQSGNLSFEMSSLDETLYTFQPKRGDKKRFRLLEPEKSGLPPRITAEGMSPEPTLVWARDPEGDLRHYFKYR